MKNSITVLAIVLLSVFNAAANENQHEPKRLLSYYSPSEEEIMSPDTVIESNTTKEIDEVIYQDCLITESLLNDQLPEAAKKTIEEVISEDSKIIENAELTIAPLDFKKINRKEFSKISKKVIATL